MLSDTWIQYGALGVLSIVLVGVGYWLRWYTKETQAFIRDLVDKRDANMAQERDSWRELVRSSVQAQESATSALKQIADGLERLSERQDEGMEALREGQGTIITRLRLKEMK